MAYNRDELLFLNRIKQTDKGISMSVFLDEDERLLAPVSLDDIKDTGLLTGTFNDEDFPYGDHRRIPTNFEGLFNHLPKTFLSVNEYGTNNIYYTNIAPKVGYYVELMVTVNDTNRGDNIISGSDMTIITEDDPQRDLFADIDVRVVSAQKLEEPDNWYLSEDELFYLGGAFMNDEITSQLKEWLTSYFLLLPYNYNKDFVEELLGGTN